MSGTYRYTGTTWYRNGDVVECGDTVSPTAAEKESFGDVLEPVDDEPEPEPEPDTDDDPTDDGEAVVGGETHECGAETSDGGTCSREVDGPDERCWAHTEE